MADGIIPTGGSYSDRKVIGGVNGVNIYSDPIDMSASGQGWYVPGQGWVNADGTPQTNDPKLFNPYTMGYVSGGQWHPYQQYVPDKIIPSQWTQTPEQTVGAAQYFINGQVATEGAPQPQKPMDVSAASTPTRSQDVQNPNPFSGMMFGNNGSLGKIAGDVDPKTGAFFSQPANNPAQPSNPLLGTLQPWSPNLSALQQSR